MKLKILPRSHEAHKEKTFVHLVSLWD